MLISYSQNLTKSLKKRTHKIFSDLVTRSYKKSYRDKTWSDLARSDVCFLDLGRFNFRPVCKVSAIQKSSAISVFGRKLYILILLIRLILNITFLFEFKNYYFQNRIIEWLKLIRFEYNIYLNKLLISRIQLDSWKFYILWTLYLIWKNKTII